MNPEKILLSISKHEEDRYDGKFYWIENKAFNDAERAVKYLNRKYEPEYSQVYVKALRQEYLRG